MWCYELLWISCVYLVIFVLVTVNELQTLVKGSHG